jgi:hypothetical protein
MWLWQKLRPQIGGADGIGVGNDKFAANFKPVYGQ